MPLYELTLLGATGLLTAALTAVIGFGGGTIMMAVFLLFVPPAAAIPFHGLVQVFSNAWRIVLFRQYISWKLALRYTALLPFGVAVGLWFFQGLSAQVLQMLIGSFVLGTLFTRQLKRFQGKDLPLAAFWPLGFVMGILNMMVGVVAPLLGVLVVRRELRKEGMIATLAYLSLAGHVAKVVAFGLAGFSFTAYLPALAVLVPSVMVGGVLGKWLLGRVNERVFMLVFQFLLVGLSLKLIVWDGLLKLI
jgi:uncharacterized membrane protein YfcA